MAFFEYLWLPRTRFAQAARVDNFSAADIAHPTKERTLELLSAFINFVKFTEERNDTYIAGLRGGSDKLIADLAKAKDKYADLSRKVNSIKFVYICSRSNVDDYIGRSWLRMSLGVRS